MATVGGRGAFARAPEVRAGHQIARGRFAFQQRQVTEDVLVRGKQQNWLRSLSQTLVGEAHTPLRGRALAGPRFHFLGYEMHAQRGRGLRLLLEEIQGRIGQDRSGPGVHDVKEPIKVGMALSLGAGLQTRAFYDRIVYTFVHRIILMRAGLRE